MKRKLLIIGASGHGKVVADVALKMNKWDEVVFLDDNDDIELSMGIEKIGGLNYAFANINDYDIFVGIGNNYIREKIQKQFEVKNANIPTLIHPTAVIGKQVSIAQGTVVMAGVVINPCTTIGKGCIINTGATVDHDNVIEDFVHISPGVHLAGTVKIGNKSWLGIGSIVSNNINIVSDCKLGAGSVVVNDVNEPGTYVGVPIKKL